MKKFNTIEEVARVLGDGGPHGSDTSFETVEQVVDALVDLGNTDKVFVRHDDHLGLKDDLPTALLQSPLGDVQNPEFNSGIEAILEQANTIIPLSERELSEDDEQEISEDQHYRGVDVDD